ncbi:Uncharacterized protein TCAP_01068, partial [Tolypocladium capitatum]
FRRTSLQINRRSDEHRRRRQRRRRQRARETRGDTTRTACRAIDHRPPPRPSEREPKPPSMAQDMPPKGGYEPVQYKRNLPAKGFRPGILLLGMGAVMGYGWYKLVHGIREAKYVLRPPLGRTVRREPWVRSMLTANASELAREKMWARIHLIPLLQAEEDRDQVRRYWADQKREKELLGDNTKVYNNDRFVRPTFAVAPAPSK